MLISSVLGSDVSVGGGSGIDGAGVNSAGGSVGTAQAGGGNTTDSSLGTVQVGGAKVAPALAASTPFGNADLGGASGVDGGANQAGDSVGTAQIGGGNSATGSTGAAQVSGVGVGPTLAVSETPAGDASVGGSSGIAGGGNDASDSAGTVQVGGGNSADSSTGTAQGGPANVGQSVGYDGTIIGSGGLGGEPTGLAGGPIFAASGLDVGANANASNGAADDTTSPVAEVPSGRRGLTQVPGAREVAGAPYANGPSGSSSLDLVTIAGQLPFTGLGLALFLMLGVAVASAGFTLRTHAAR